MDVNEPRFTIQPHGHIYLFSMLPIKYILRRKCFPVVYFSSNYLPEKLARNFLKPFLEFETVSIVYLFFSEDAACPDKKGFRDRLKLVVVI